VSSKTPAPDIRLVVAGRIKDRAAGKYWRDIEQYVIDHDLSHRVQAHVRFIPDAEIEVFFKAADVCVLPYVRIDHSGVLSLAYRYGLPVIGTDAGGLREEIVEATTGYCCRRGDPEDLARAIDRYFSNALFAELEETRESIRSFARARYDWTNIARTIADVYSDLLAVNAKSHRARQ
jgi:glycosyltransferase involved in cell wall biosynthesis